MENNLKGKSNTIDPEILDKNTVVMVTYSVNRNDQNGEHVTIHTTNIEFNGPAAEGFTAADVLNRLIWTVCAENPGISSGSISLINYWVIFSTNNQ